MQQTKRNTPRQLALVFRDPNSFASTLLVEVLDFYGPEVLEWAPGTIRQELIDDIGDELVLDSNFQKLMSAITIVTTDQFYVSLPAFVQLVSGLTGSMEEGYAVPPDPEELAWAIIEAAMIYTPEDEEEFNQEIRHYIGEICARYQVLLPPDVLQLGMPAPSFDEFPDDEVAMQMQHDKNAEIKLGLRQRMAMLKKQLSELKLDEGSIEGAFTRDPVQSVKDLVNPDASPFARR